MKKFLFVILLIIYCLQLTAQRSELQIPQVSKHDKILVREGYTLCYNEQYRLAQWVAWVLTAQETHGTFDRFKCVFEPDPNVENSADQSDYYSTGYDRGHLVPAGDLEFSEKAMQESFYFSNISPQNPKFNRGIWKRLENLCRKWAVEYDSVFIVCGPVLKKQELSTIGVHKISVPEYFYKVIMRIGKDGEYYAVGFVLPNEDSNAKLSSKAMTVNEVEKITGLDFFYRLPNKIERKMEKSICKECWDWRETKH
ncbi:MAG: DNA/RNA non-specific endonuclease [Bacteroidales bacterium]|jgi:endonuclease G|nr:DNA/RNA non-specific endonuclease [Bacteroidales bacterium]